MAEQQAPTIQNKKLLIIALVLAAVVVVIYQVHINQVREGAREPNVKLLRFTRDMAGGEEIEDKYIEAHPVPASVAEGLLKTVVRADRINYVRGQRLRRRVQRDDWLEWGDITGVDSATPSVKISADMRARSIAVDPDQTPGEMLRTGDRVDLMGRVRLSDGSLQPYRIIEGLKVLEVGGRWEGDTEAEGLTAAAGSRSNKRVTVEMSPEASRQLAAVMPHVVGSPWLELRRPDDPLPSLAGQVNSELLQRLPDRPSGRSIRGG